MVSTFNSVSNARPQEPSPTETAPRRYRFGFVLSTALGNRTRYENFRRFAERDSEVECVWAPVKHYIAPGEPDPFRRWPGALRTRAIVLYQSAPVLERLSSLDAIMIHMYEVDLLTAVRSLWASRPLRVISSDDAPAADPNYPLHPVELLKPAWRRALRLRIDLWRARRADLLIPFSKWAGDTLVEAAGVPLDRVRPVHVGLDLGLWRAAPKPEVEGARVKLLFVGADFERKGGADLLEAFLQEGLGDVTELHLVTQTAPSALPNEVYVHADFTANDPRLAALYREADIFVMPTRSDLTPWAILEAMASGCAVVTTRVGGLGDLVVEGETGLFVGVGDLLGLSRALRSLVEDPPRRRAMGAAGRKVIENQYDASVNVPRILDAMKAAVDTRALREHRLAGARR
jgi:glycosyltransferase involved in cell wall biosynthesis